MANYHLEIKTIGRRKGPSVTKATSYICGRSLYDSYKERLYSNPRKDVVRRMVFLPDTAPPEFQDLQHLSDEIEGAEVRKDARTAREFIGSLPNELPPGEWVRIVRDFIRRNFVAHGLCAIAAIHRGLNRDDPSRNNPHVHIIVPTRTVGPDGFCKKKDREHDDRKYVRIWREQWAVEQNRAYERNHLDIRVSHERLEVQGVRDRQPTIHLSLADWQREKRGIRTRAGDRKREIEERNKEHDRRRQAARERKPDADLSRKPQPEHKRDLDIDLSR